MKPSNRFIKFWDERRVFRRTLGKSICLGWITAVILLSISPPTYADTLTPVIETQSSDPIPVMAYYYIWFDVGSWNRAKTDYPLLGRYSSDNRNVMEQHVRWAKDAGIDGFIVSWKSTYLLDRRLEQLMEIAAAEDFDLWIMYQGLDFERNPLPVSWIDADLAYFVEEYAEHPAFAMYDKPIVIWSGTWEFTEHEIETTTSSYRDQLTILATERNIEGYSRLANIVDGNAYYWSSVNPSTYPGYQEKLNAMSQAIHQNGGLWIAPAAPGFDARLLGGSSVTERLDGETLRTEIDTAVSSSPDAIGLISWNEFSENTHIEPSLNYGNRSLEVLADIHNGVAPIILDFDSSAPATTNPTEFYPILIIGGVFALICLSFIMIMRNTRRHIQVKKIT